MILSTNFLSEAARPQGGASRIAETFQSRRKCGVPDKNVRPIGYLKSLHSPLLTRRAILQHLRRGFIFFLVLLIFPCLPNAEETGRNGFPQSGAKANIAIFPVENLSGTAAPLKQVRQGFVEELKKQGIHVLEDESFEKFMARHRIRYTGGLDRDTAKAFKNEMGTDGILIISLESYSETNPPKISFLSRLVSTGDPPAILWMEGIGLAGDDSPGILGLGLIEDPKELWEKALKSVTGSLVRYLSTGMDEKKIDGTKRKFKPKLVYQSWALDPNRKYRVGVTPFFNRSERKYAGEILVLHFIRQLKRFGNFEVIEPGMLRQELLDLRIIMQDGVSLANADAIFAALEADLLVSGRVMDYQDYQGIWGKPKVDFSATVIERESREVIWSSSSYNEGDDGVFFFDRGRVNTAHAMASQMVQRVAKRMAPLR
jgi:TolB-like protein